MKDYQSNSDSKCTKVNVGNEGRVVDAAFEDTLFDKAIAHIQREKRDIRDMEYVPDQSDVIRFIQRCEEEDVNPLEVAANIFQDEDLDNMEEFSARKFKVVSFLSAVIEYIGRGIISFATDKYGIDAESILLLVKMCLLKMRKDDEADAPKNPECAQGDEADTPNKDASDDVACGGFAKCESPRPRKFAIRILRNW